MFLRRGQKLIKLRRLSRVVADGKRIGEVLLQLNNITLSFGAVQALSE